MQWLLHLIQNDDTIYGYCIINGVELFLDGVLFLALIKGRHNVIGKQFYG